MRKRLMFWSLCFLLSSVIFAQKKADTLTVMTFNILHGATMQNDYNLEAIAGFINKFNPDLVALQEVDVNTKRAKNYNLPLELGYRTKLNPIFSRAMYYDGGEYGEAVLIKNTIIYAENISLPYLPNSEPRSAQLVRFETKNKNIIQFVGTHLDHQDNENDRLFQANALANRFKYETYPTILVGDLNAEPSSKTIAKIKEVFTMPSHKAAGQPTFPSDGPNKCIDYILFNQPKNWRVLSYDIVCDDYVTDHCVVIAKLVYTPVN